MVDTAFALSAGFLLRVGRGISCQASLLFFFILRPQALRAVGGRYDYYSQLASAPLSLLVVLRVSAWSSGMLRRLLCGAAVTQETPDTGRGSQPPPAAAAPAGAGSDLGVFTTNSFTTQLFRS